MDNEKKEMRVDIEDIELRDDVDYSGKSLKQILELNPQAKDLVNLYVKQQAEIKDDPIRDRTIDVFRDLTVKNLSALGSAGKIDKERIEKILDEAQVNALEIGADDGLYSLHMESKTGGAV